MITYPLFTTDRSHLSDSPHLRRRTALGPRQNQEEQRQPEVAALRYPTLFPLAFLLSPTVSLLPNPSPGVEYMSSSSQPFSYVGLSPRDLWPSRELAHASQHLVVYEGRMGIANAKIPETLTPRLWRGDGIGGHPDTEVCPEVAGDSQLVHNSIADLPRNRSTTNQYVRPCFADAHLDAHCDPSLWWWLLGRCVRLRGFCASE